MKRFVDIDKFKEQIQHAIDNYNLGFSNGYYLAEDVIEDINFNNFELADVEEIRYGKWVWVPFDDMLKCSACGYICTDTEDLERNPEFHKYCGHCGAKMIEE